MRSNFNLLCIVLIIEFSVPVFCSADDDQNLGFGYSERTEDSESEQESTNPTSSETDNMSTMDETQEVTTTEEILGITKKIRVTPKVTPTKISKNTTEVSYTIKDICANFKYAGPIVLNKMVDLWQTAYYSSPQKVPCFKMFIRRLTMKEKQLFKLKYGSFDDAVEWEDCNLEIRSSLEAEKHFLQGCEKGHGVLENIIIGARNVTGYNTTDFYQKPESPDQWLVVQNLLLKRNCDTGDVIVFSRVPHKPRNSVIAEALKIFGESDSDGKFVCGDQPPIKKKAHEVEEEIDESN
ncbi:PREDICTED: uncharacterized protein LOC106102694 [Papilio polytes]|uniref:uncharacterized protein LOC106102694 n=1 Tax=Papilio polytes TaxID=76194 RepID=UPI000675F052|nr:PREDICTED: uncharacterized protein LOC106102694 [Papilio polytes]